MKPGAVLGCILAAAVFAGGATYAVQSAAATNGAGDCAAYDRAGRALGAFPLPPSNPEWLLPSMRPAGYDDSTPMFLPRDPREQERYDAAQQAFDEAADNLTPAEAADCKAARN